MNQWFGRTDLLFTDGKRRVGEGSRALRERGYGFATRNVTANSVPSPLTASTSA